MPGLFTTLLLAVIIALSPSCASISGTGTPPLANIRGLGQLCWQSA